ncbi:hypothetical protein [Escherichia coli]|uniref:hypothetical protein n=1 Tax=Escherichia coli TaxID=562 RepID=UPI0015E0AE35|nr:hypothetical protein [Escherichia coli]
MAKKNFKITGRLNTCVKYIEYDASPIFVKMFLGASENITANRTIKNAIAP